jgi:hypothetical protein
VTTTTATKTTEGTPATVPFLCGECARDSDCGKPSKHHMVCSSEGQCICDDSWTSTSQNSFGKLFYQKIKRRWRSIRQRSNLFQMAAAPSKRATSRTRRSVHPSHQPQRHQRTAMRRPQLSITPMFLTSSRSATNAPSSGSPSQCRPTITCGPILTTDSTSTRFPCAPSKTYQVDNCSLDFSE